MARKKIVLVIVEGPSDDDALGLMFKHFFERYNNQEARVHIMFRDITTEYGNVQCNIITAIDREVKKYANNNHLQNSHFSEIIHIVDTDGVFVDNSKVVEDLTKEEVFYTVTEIRTKDKLGIEKRNLQKRENLERMIGKKVIGNINYNVYYMSCNLDHVLHNKLNSTDEEKEQDAFAFVSRYENDLQGFLDYVSKSNFSVTGNYEETWSFIKEDRHSLERHTNIGLCFVR